MSKQSEEAFKAIQGRARKAEKLGKVSIPDYVKFSRFGIDQVLCKCCGCVIKGTVIRDDWTETRMINGKPVIFQRLALAQLAEYAEVEILFDDGSRHVTCCCVHCSEHLTPDHLEHIYCCDMLMWEKEAAATNTHVAWERYEKRRPVSHRRVR